MKNYDEKSFQNINKHGELTDCGKFIVMANFFDIYKGQESFAKLLGISHQSVNNWIRCEIKTINISNKNKINKSFNLLPAVWTDLFYDIEVFEESLPTYHKEDSKNSTDKLDKYVLNPITAMTTEEKELITQLSSEITIDISSISFKENTASFLNELSKLLQEKEQIPEAITILEQIEELDSMYRYKYHNILQHRKAILLSHDSIRKWDEAIHLLRLLYMASTYHEKEPEILTLLASNYKRKALLGSSSKNKWLKKEEVDVDLLFLALNFYYDAYNSKKEERYYDAINYAYLLKILEHFEGKLNDDFNELDSLYKELTSEWKVNYLSWWEVSSRAEFALLMGDDHLAAMLIDDFLETHTLTAFEFDTTLRQLELYIHFTGDVLIKSFRDYLIESFKSI
jgi:hypothetical protein